MFSEKQIRGAATEPKSPAARARRESEHGPLAATTTLHWQRRAQRKKSDRKCFAGTPATWVTLQSSARRRPAKVLFPHEVFQWPRSILPGLCWRTDLPLPSPDIPANCEIRTRTEVAEQQRHGSPVSGTARNRQDCRCPRWRQKEAAMQSNFSCHTSLGNV